MKNYKSVLTAAVLAAMIGTTAFAAGVPLKDISNYWGKDAIQYFYDNNYVSGVNGNFNPNEDITREGVASILNNIVGGESSTMNNNFKDMTGRWSYAAVNNVTAKRIMNGYTDLTFKPAQLVTRQEFAVTAYNYMNYRGIAGSSVTSSNFLDNDKIASWAKEAIDTLSSSGFMTGSYNYFHPTENVTRGEAVNVLYRIMTDSKVATDANTKVETQVFNDITDVYGSVKKFADDGIMYWQADKLHIGCKNDAKRQKLSDAIAADTNLPVNTVMVQHAKYSYNDYKKLMETAASTYRATESTNATVKTDVDYLNEKVVLTVNSITKDTQKNILKKCGDAVKIVIQ